MDAQPRCQPGTRCIQCVPEVAHVLQQSVSRGYPPDLIACNWSLASPLLEIIQPRALQYLRFALFSRSVCYFGIMSRRCRQKGLNIIGNHFVSVGFPRFRSFDRITCPHQECVLRRQQQNKPVAPCPSPHRRHLLSLPASSRHLGARIEP